MPIARKQLQPALARREGQASQSPERTRSNAKDGHRTVQQAAETTAASTIEPKLRTATRVTVHSLRVTGLTIAKERGSDIIDLQQRACHADPRTTLTYFRLLDSATGSAKARPMC